MTILFVILGVLLIGIGISVVATPLLSFLGVGTLLAIVLLIWGIMTAIKRASEKQYGLPFALSIMAIILGFILIISPSLSFLTNVTILYVAAAFLVIRGLSSIYLSIKTKKENKSWVFGILIGILAILVGILCFVHPLISATMIGIMIGVYFMFAGMDMIYIGAVGSAISNN